ncbi:MAG TPA: type II toxin-antitoxin system Phd/YefM family antitoxin [Methylococcus sp.]|nr:type II toxin-antitoxin system Phd/YefM family antitoxin [Methylococcus sp.]
MQITAAEFKAKCLKLMDEIAKTREPIVITKRGKPIAKLMPVDEEPKSLFGYMKGKVTILGDIVSPLEEPWSVLTGDENELYEDLGPRKNSVASEKNEESTK